MPNDSTNLEKLAQKWEAEANQYQKQVEEAKAKETPYDAMTAHMICLRSCSKQLMEEL